MDAGSVFTGAAGVEAEVPLEVVGVGAAAPELAAPVEVPVLAGTTAEEVPVAVAGVVGAVATGAGAGTGFGAGIT